MARQNLVRTKGREGRWKQLEKIRVSSCFSHLGLYSSSFYLFMWKNSVREDFHLRKRPNQNLYQNLLKYQNVWQMRGLRKASQHTPKCKRLSNLEVLHNQPTSTIELQLGHYRMATTKLRLRLGNPHWRRLCGGQFKIKHTYISPQK